MKNNACCSLIKFHKRFRRDWCKVLETCLICNHHFKTIHFNMATHKETVFTTHAPSPIGPYSQAIKIHGTLFVSGQIALNPNTNELVTSNIEQETRQVMLNIGEILKTATSTPSIEVPLLSPSTFSVFITTFILYANVCRSQINQKIRGSRNGQYASSRTTSQ